MTDPGSGDRFLDVELPHSFRGVDPDAVQDLLTQAKDALRQAQEREVELKTTVASLEAELADARADATAELAEARRRGREMVNEAQTVRRRILEDLIRRRTVLRRQIEQLRVGRERLLEAYEVVGQTVEEATHELHLAVPAAQAAAQRAGRRAGPDAQEVTDEELHAMEAEIDAARAAGLPILEPPTTAGRAAGRSGAGGTAADPSTGEEGEEVPPLAEVEAVVASFEEVRVLAVPEAAPEPVPSSPPTTATDDQPDGDLGPDGDTETDGAAGPGGEAALDEVGEGGEGDDGDEVDDGEAAGATGETPPAVAAAVADEALVLPLFDRLRADADEAEDAAEAEAVVEAIEAEPDAGDEATDPVAVLADELARRLRRALADEQNQVLDRLRQDQRGQLDLDTALGDPDALVVRLATTIEPGLREASIDAGGDGAVGDVAARLAGEVVDGVRADVARHGAGGGDDLVRPVRDAFRGWRTDRIVPLAAAVAAEVLDT